MSQYDNTNRGAIWKNDKREKETQPHFTGSLNVEGREFTVSAWKRGEDDSDRAPALRFSIKPKEEAKPQTMASKAKVDPELDDDIPF
jgi:hypothetical protein